MEHFKTLSLNKFNLKPKCRFQFVDDTFVVWPHDHPSLISFFNHLNNISPQIQFTMEMQRKIIFSFFILFWCSHLLSSSHPPHPQISMSSLISPTQKSIILKTLVTRFLLCWPLFLDFFFLKKYFFISTFLFKEKYFWIKISYLQ